MEKQRYKFIDETKILPLGKFTEKIFFRYIYANGKDISEEYKELVIEEKPEYDEETQELYSWFEDGEVITQKFKVIDKLHE